jgi:hypothetical protein
MGAPSGPVTVPVMVAASAAEKAMDPANAKSPSAPMEANDRMAFPRVSFA